MQAIMDDARATGMAWLSARSAVPFYLSVGFAVPGAKDMVLPGAVAFSSMRMFPGV